jgi:Concanavalin A-like lectin/glucanases superfamily
VPTFRSRRHLRHAVSVLAISALAAAGLSAASAGPVQATAAQATGKPAATSAPLTASQAKDRADATGKSVTVSALTTPTSVTTASPGGKLTITETSQPTRAWRDSRWQALNPALRAGPDGTLSPAVATSALTLSAGGTGPMAVMHVGGRSLSLYWPGALPAPSVSGATATYTDVLPGVDLVVTADDQGGFSDVVVVHSAAAAANPALASLSLTVASQGLTLSADAAGNLAAAADPAAPPVITAQAPLMWDSTPPPASMPTTTGPDGTTVNADNGLPAESSVTAPGSGAHVTTVGVALSGSTLTLTPPAAALTGSDIDYPLYIDPTWHAIAGNGASAWTQADSGKATTSYWQESSDLQVGQCYDDPAGSCNGIGATRSFIRMPIPSALTATSVVALADLYMTEVWAPSCTPEPVRLYTTGSIGSTTTWDNQPAWSSSYSSQDAAFGYPGCGYKPNDMTWNVTSTVAGDAGVRSTQTWGLRAADESDNLEWKQFYSGAKNLTLSVQYNDPPNKPDRSTSPGGACYYGASGAPVIGDDDVTFSASASDNDGDNDLTTRFIILNASGSTAYDSSSAGTNVATGDKALAKLTLTRAVMQALNTDGSTKEYTYHWYAIVTDSVGLTNPTPADECYFTYNPLGPAAPTVTVPTSGTLGQQVPATFTAPANCGSANPCPTSYIYQLGAAPPVTVADDSGSNWTGDITVSQVGPIQVTVYGIASGGNPGEAATAEILGTEPATAFSDGYFSGGTYPDLLTIGSGAKPSLWLSTGSASGTLNPAADIGSLGTGIDAGSDGPGDWAGAIVLHGDFTADNVQDVMAYYPSGPFEGLGKIIAGNGNASSLVPNSTNLSLVDPDLMQNPVTGAYPTTLAGAGNASGLGTGTDDLIGISGNTTSPGNYELDLYTNGQCADCAQIGGYGYDETLTITSPDGTSDWNNYALATAGNPASTSLFALDTATGALYECASPAALAAGTATWTQITVPWGASPPKLASADINHAGQTELWTLSGTKATAYVLSGGTITAEAATTSVSAPSHDWPLTDGSPLAQTGTAATAVDTVTGDTAAMTSSGSAWTDDDYFSTDVSLLGNGGYLTPPASTIPASDTTPSISVWFATTTADGVLVSVQDQALSAGSTIPGEYDPVMYVGTDGKLRAEWWTGTVAPITSTAAVDDGLWHHAVLTASAGTESLYIDGKLQAALSGTAGLGNLPDLDFGAGYLGGSWPTEPHHEQSGSTGYLDYFNGTIADITLTQ